MFHKILFVILGNTCTYSFMFVQKVDENFSSCEYFRAGMNIVDKIANFHLPI